MSQFPEPRGALTRPVPDWYANTMMGGYTQGVSSAGNFGFIGLFNDSSNSKDIWVYGFQGTTFPAAASDVALESVQGHPGTLDTNQAPTRIQAAYGPGKLFTFNGPVCLGLHQGYLRANPICTWPYSWPMAIIPPGWSFMLQTFQTGQGWIGGFYWCAF